MFGLVAVRREVLLRHGGFDESILWTTDWECWIRLVLSGSKIGCIDAPLALYRLREDSLSARREDLTRGKIMTLEKTRANALLRGDERAVIEEALAGYRRELRFTALGQTLAAGDPGVRRLALGAGHGHGG